MLRLQWFKQAKVIWPKRWPGMQKAIARSAHLCQQQQSALEVMLTEKLNAIAVTPKTLSKRAFLSQDQRLHSELLRVWLSRLTQHLPSLAQLDEILKVIPCDADKSPVVQWYEHEFRVFGDTLYFFPTEFQPHD